MVDTESGRIRQLALRARQGQIRMAIEELRQRRKRFQKTMAAIEGIGTGNAEPDESRFDFGESDQSTADDIGRE